MFPRRRLMTVQSQRDFRRITQERTSSNSRSNSSVRAPPETNPACQSKYRNNSLYSKISKMTPIIEGLIKSSQQFPAKIIKQMEIVSNVIEQVNHAALLQQQEISFDKESLMERFLQQPNWQSGINVEESNVRLRLREGTGTDIANEQKHLLGINLLEPEGNSPLSIMQASSFELLRKELDLQKQHNSGLQQALSTKTKEIAQLKMHIQDNLQGNQNGQVQTLRFNCREFNELSEGVPTSRSDYDHVSLLKLQIEQLKRKNSEYVKQIMQGNNKWIEVAQAFQGARKGIAYLEDQNRKKASIIQGLQAKLDTTNNEYLLQLQDQNRLLKTKLSAQSQQLEHMRKSIHSIINKPPPGNNSSPYHKIEESRAINFQFSTDTHLQPFSPDFRQRAPKATTQLQSNTPSNRSGYTSSRYELSMHPGNDYHKVKKVSPRIPSLDLHSGSSQFSKVRKVMNQRL